MCGDGSDEMALDGASKVSKGTKTLWPVDASLSYHSHRVRFEEVSTKTLNVESLDRG